MFIFQPFTYELHSCSYVRQSTLIFGNAFLETVFGNAVLYSFIQKSATVRFFEYAANSADVERLRQEGETSRSRGETGDIFLLNEI